MELFRFLPDYITKIVFWNCFPKNFPEQLIAKIIVDFNCKPTDCVDGFGAWMLPGVQIFWIFYTGTSIGRFFNK